MFSCWSEILVLIVLLLNICCRCCVYWATIIFAFLLVFLFVFFFFFLFTWCKSFLLVNCCALLFLLLLAPIILVQCKSLYSFSSCLWPFPATIKTQSGRRQFEEVQCSAPKRLDSVHWQTLRIYVLSLVVVVVNWVVEVVVVVVTRGNLIKSLLIVFKQRRKLVSVCPSTSILITFARARALFALSSVVAPLSLSLSLSFCFVVDFLSLCFFCFLLQNFVTSLFICSSILLRLF